MGTPLFHRFGTPTYFGGLPADYDYINNAAGGTPAYADGAKTSGPNAGSYFVAFGEDATSADANRPAQALAQNCDFLDDTLHRDVSLPVGTVAVTPGSAVPNLVLTGPGIFMGLAGATIAEMFQVTDQNDEDIDIGGTLIVVTTAVDGGGVLIGGGFSLGNVTLTFNISIPSGQPYRIWYGERTNFATFPADGLMTTHLRSLTEIDAQVEELFRTLHGGGQSWNAAWDTTIHDINQLTTVTGVDVLLQVASITALRALAPGGLAVNEIALVLNYGLYAWSSASTAIDDGVDVVQPSTAPSAGRWLSMRYAIGLLPTSLASSVMALNWVVGGTYADGGGPNSAACWDPVYDRVFMGTISGGTGSRLPLPAASYDGCRTWVTYGSNDTVAVGDYQSLALAVRPSDGLLAHVIGGSAHAYVGGTATCPANSGTWVYAVPGTIAATKAAMVWAPTASAFIVACTLGSSSPTSTGGAVYSSPDGVTWSELAFPSSWTSLTTAPTTLTGATCSAGTMFAANSSGVNVVIASALGVTFTDVTPPGVASTSSILGLAVDTSGVLPLWVVTVSTNTPSLQIYVSTNLGVTWTLRHTLAGATGGAIACNQRTWAMMLFDSPRTGGEDMVWSNDQGLTWRYCTSRMSAKTSGAHVGAFDSLLGTGRQFLSFNSDFYSATLLVGQSSVTL